MFPGYIHPDATIPPQPVPGNPNCLPLHTPCSLIPGTFDPTRIHHSYYANLPPSDNTEYMRDRFAWANNKAARVEQRIRKAYEAEAQGVMAAHDRYAAACAAEDAKISAARAAANGSYDEGVKRAQARAEGEDYNTILQQHVGATKLAVTQVEAAARLAKSTCKARRDEEIKAIRRDIRLKVKAIKADNDLTYYFMRPEDMPGAPA